MSAGNDNDNRKRGSGGRQRPNETDGKQPHPVLTPLTVSQAVRLVRLAEDAVARRGMPMQYDGAGALIPVGSDGVAVHDGMVAGLANLARTVAGLPRQQWRSAVAAHFDQMTAPDGPPPIPDDLESELYLRLVCASTIEPAWAERVPEFAPGVLTVPATYTGRAVAMHFDIDSLGVTREEATRMGLSNLRRLRDKVEHVHYNGAEITALTGSMFTASRALVLDTVLLESLQVENPPFGCLVAMPVRDMLLVHVLRDQTALTALDMLVTLSTTLFISRPGPASPHVYYATDHEWHQVTDGTGEIRVQDAGQLSDAMKRLGADRSALL
ncbi:hypothetical protein EV644_104106 [Kribbella orskensis]|uniref:Uncharacterized protein n=1 Tax=Kribbella orskensis TaxID=2512216 RepID=A0ABY2BMJ3_9ACTN|nr:hypothetical protein EV642_103106 [Kribbella sp. VKM Ac-2500]TCO25602.1 hypothetical protein EV644_104106 [Kribbella orskensis]